MESAYTIVVPDYEILSQVCGTNDSNLRLIEKYLGVTVFTRGNELSVGDAEPETLQRFKYIIDRILDEVLEGTPAVPDMISSILLDSDQKNNKYTTSEQFFSDCCIRIPGSIKSVYPKSRNQADFIYAMRNYDVVFGIGPAGCGKTFLAIVEALCQLLQKGTGKIILTRPVVEAGESLGFLPGDFEQKISPYLRPLFDAAESLLPTGVFDRMMESGIIEIAPLAYMRGRTLDNSILILDEAQNTTKEQMKMFLTRMGQGSKVFITGDITQINLPKRITSGLVHGLEILNDIAEIKQIQLEACDIVRNPLVKKIVQAYSNGETNV